MYFVPMWGDARPKLGTGLKKLPNRLSPLLAKITSPLQNGHSTWLVCVRISPIVRHNRHLPIASCSQSPMIVKHITHLSRGIGALKLLFGRYWHAPCLLKCAYFFRTADLEAEHAPFLYSSPVFSGFVLDLSLPPRRQYRQTDRGLRKAHRWWIALRCQYGEIDRSNSVQLQNVLPHSTENRNSQFGALIQQAQPWLLLAPKIIPRP